MVIRHKSASCTTMNEYEEMDNEKIRTGSIVSKRQKRERA